MSDIREVLADAAAECSLDANGYQLAYIGSALESAISTLPKQEGADGWTPTHKHVKRGSEYEHIGTGRIQSDEPLKDMDCVEVYLGREGDLWARRQSEFHDGRFAALQAQKEEGDA